MSLPSVAEGDAGQVTQGVPTAGVIPSGARIEKEIEFNLSELELLRLALREADFTTAGRIEQAINNNFGRRVAVMLDSGTVELNIKSTRMRSVAHALGRIENIEVQPERRARVEISHCVFKKHPWSCNRTRSQRGKPSLSPEPMPRLKKNRELDWPRSLTALPCPRSLRG